MFCANAKFSLILWYLRGAFLTRFTRFPSKCGFTFPAKYVSLVEYF